MYKASYFVCLQALMNVSYAHTIIISSLSAPGLCLAAVAKGPQFHPKNPLAEFLAAGLHGMLCIHMSITHACT